MMYVKFKGTLFSAAALSLMVAHAIYVSASLSR